MATFFRDYFWNLLPDWFTKVDSYKDNNDEGLLRRYLRDFGMEIDEQMIDFVKFFLNILNPIKCPENLLVYLGGNMGYMPDLNGDFDIYRKLIAYAVQIYKLKGSLLSFELVFRILGFSIVLTEIEPEQPVNYDDGKFYDDGKTYDSSSCQWCSGFTLELTPLVFDPEFEVTPELLDTIVKTCDFLKPINAVLISEIVLPFTSWEPIHPYCIYSDEIGFTGEKGWYDRRRLIDGVADGYEEPNVDGEGLGDYFPPESGYDLCAPTIPNMLFGVIDDISEITNLSDAQLLLTPFSSADIDISCDYTYNAEPKILVMVEPEYMTPKDKWEVFGVDNGNIGNEGDLFYISTVIEGYRMYYTAYPTQQTMNPVIFKKQIL